jgi:prolyl oligopeptidase
VSIVSLVSIQTMKYPAAPRSDVIDRLHGVPVADPFRRLESPDDPDTIAWVAGQNALTRRLLDSPLREGLVARLRQLHRVSRMSVPAVRGDRLFFTETDGTRAQPALYRAERCAPRAADESAAAAPMFSVASLVDPNLLDAGGTTAITAFEPDDIGNRGRGSRRPAAVGEVRVRRVARRWIFLHALPAARHRRG